MGYKKEEIFELIKEEIRTAVLSGLSEDEVQSSPGGHWEMPPEPDVGTPGKSILQLAQELVEVLRGEPEGARAMELAYESLYGAAEEPEEEELKRPIGFREGQEPQTSAMLEEVANSLQDAHALMQEVLEAGEYDMYTEEKLEEISEGSFEMYQTTMHIVQGSMSE